MEACGLGAHYRKMMIPVVSARMMDVVEMMRVMTVATTDVLGMVARAAVYQWNAAVAVADNVVQSPVGEWLFDSFENYIAQVTSSSERH